MAYLNSFMLFSLLVALASFVAHAGQSSNRQDFCVATDDPNGILRVDGRFCKNPANVTVDDFVTSILKVPTFATIYGYNIAIVRVNELPGLNTLGISMTRLTFEPYGVNPLHSHPRATELFIVLTGTFYCGFVSSSLSQGVIQNRLYARVLSPGEVMVFPRGCPQFQYNMDSTPGLILAAYNSEDFGLIRIGDVVFGAQPSIEPVVIALSLQINRTLVEGLQANFTRSMPI